MTLSAWLFLSDIYPSKKGFFDLIAKKDVYGKDIRGGLKKLKQAGFDGIELLLSLKFSEDDLMGVDKLLKEVNLQVNSIHQALGSFHKTDISEVERLCGAAKFFGAKIVVLHISNAGRQVFDKAYIERIHDFEEQFDVRIGFENGQEFFLRRNAEYTWRPEDVENLAKANGFHITLDTTHLGQVKGDLIGFFDGNRDRIVNIHLSDYSQATMQKSFRPTAGMHLPLGKGDLPIKKLLSMLKNQGYTGNITLEVSGTLNDICSGARLVREVISPVVSSQSVR